MPVCVIPIDCLQGTERDEEYRGDVKGEAYVAEVGRRLTLLHYEPIAASQDVELG